MINLRLCACAVAFQVGHEEVFFIADLKKDEGVGREKARGVVHVGVGFAGGNHEPRFGGVHYRVLMLRFSWIRRSGCLRA